MYADHYSHSVAKVACLQDMSCNCHQGGGGGGEVQTDYDSWQTPQSLQIYSDEMYPKLKSINFPCTHICGGEGAVEGEGRGRGS